MDDFDFVPGFIPKPSTSTAAPKISEYDFPEEKREVRKPKAPARPAKKTQTVGDKLLKIAVSVFICAIVLAMLSSIIALNKSIVDNKKEISTLSSEINQAKAENVRLHAELGSACSADKIQEYAVSVLGMQKAERYQIHYFEDRDGDKIVIAAGKIPNTNT